MIKLLFSFLSISIICTTSNFAKNLDAHVHGVVRLDIATDKNELLIMLKSPSESILGFEYKAKTKEEINLVGRAKEQWNKNILSLFGKKSLKDCEISKTSWEQSFTGNITATSSLNLTLSVQNLSKEEKIEVSLKKFMLK